MAKRNSERPKILMQRSLQGWNPVFPHDQERMQHYAIGAQAEVEFWQKRSKEHSALYWVILADIVANSENKYGTSEDLHDALKVSLGYTRRIQTLVPSDHSKIATAIAMAVLPALNFLKMFVGDHNKIVIGLKFAINQCIALDTEKQTILMPGSVSFARMDQAAFREYFDKAMTQLDLAGYDTAAFLDEAKAKMKPTAINQAPYHGDFDAVPQEEKVTEP